MKELGFSRNDSELRTSGFHGKGIRKHSDFRKGQNLDVIVEE